MPPDGHARGLRPVALAVFLLALSFAVPVRGQTNTSTPAKAQSGNRYLLIIDTSKAMGRRAENVRGAVQDLLASGMGGQLRKGDTIGLWTYNEDLYTGKFPLQQWSPQKHQAVKEIVASFLEYQKYEKRPRFEKVLPTLQRVVAGSGCITVIWVSDGMQPVHGTPFDKSINDYFERWRSQQQETRMPFLTLLRGQRGVLTNYAMAASPWRLEFPPLPAPQKVVASTPENGPVTSKPAPAPPARMLPPLIVSGKKPQPVVAKPVEPTTVEPQVPATTAAPNTKAEPPRSVAPTTVVGGPQPGLLAGNDSQPVAPLPAAPAAITTLVQPATSATTPNEAAPPAGSGAQQEPPKQEVRPAPDPTPTTTAAGTKGEASPQSRTPAAPVPANSQTRVAEDPAPSAPPAPIATTTPAISGFGSKSMWFAGLALGLGSLGAALWWRIRLRRDEQTSLITKSLGR